MAEVVGLIGFSVVSSITPGPNNILLLASGSSFGFRRTMPHVLGTAVGIGMMALAVGAGIGVLVASVPAVAVVMKIAGSAYLLWLAVAIGRGGAVEQAHVARPLGLAQAAAFQLVNPKVWIFAVGAMSTFRPGGLPLPLGTIVVAVTMMAVVVPTAAVWAAGGRMFSRLLRDERSTRIAFLVLAVLVATTVISVWL